MEPVEDLEKFKQRIHDLENELKATKSEVETLTRKLGNVERKHEKSVAYSDELRAQFESLQAELHAYRQAARNRVDVAVQVEIVPGCINFQGNTRDGGVGIVGDYVPSTVTPTTASLSSGQPEVAVSQESSMPNWTTTSSNTGTEPEGLSIAESLKFAAEEALQQSGVVYDEGSGMYYDYNTGYYHDPDRSLYYEPKSGTYYHYNHETRAYEFHSQVDLSQYTAQSQPASSKTSRSHQQTTRTMDCEMKKQDNESVEDGKENKRKRHKKKAKREKSEDGAESKTKKSRSSKKHSSDKHSKKGEKKKHHKKKHKHKEKDEESLKKKLRKVKERKKKQKEKKKRDDTEVDVLTDKTPGNAEGMQIEEGKPEIITEQPASNNIEIKGEEQQNGPNLIVGTEYSVDCELGESSGDDQDMKATSQRPMDVSGDKREDCDNYDLESETELSEQMDHGGRRELQNDGEMIDFGGSGNDDKMSDLENCEQEGCDLEECLPESNDLEEGELSDSSQYTTSFSSGSDSESSITDEDDDDDEDHSGCSELEPDQTNSPTSKADFFNEECARYYPPCIRAMVQASDCVDVGTLFIVTCTGGTIGREKSLGHSIFIPDLQVSKMHADIKYNEEIKQYVLQDHASQNGTVLNGKRLSEPKVMSDLFPLTNGDILKLGETELEIHIHPGTDTCDGCEPGQVRARLELVEKANQEKVSEPVLTKAQREAVRRKQLRNIKRKYGLQNCSYVDNPAAIKNPSYQDKSHERRKTKGSDNPYQKDDMPASVERAISDENKGHKLMQKMGWKEGDSLGRSQEGIREPIRIRMRARQSAGLGSAGDIGHSLDNIADAKKTERWIRAAERFDKAETVAGSSDDISDAISANTKPVMTKTKLTAPAWVKGEVLEPDIDEEKPS